jgi:hypothetical protein
METDYTRNYRPTYFKAVFYKYGDYAKLRYHVQQNVASCIDIYTYISSGLIVNLFV